MSLQSRGPNTQGVVNIAGTHGQHARNLQNELLAMLDRLSRPGRFTLNGKSTPYERFYVVLVEANSVVIPEEILYKRIQALIFGHN
jgi:hypothetical protein